MRHLLVIDDDTVVPESRKTILGSAGFDGATAPNGRVGQQIVERRPPDVVVCDIFRPEQDGIETITELCRDYIGAKIIARSGGSIGGLDLSSTAKQFGAGELIAEVSSALESAE